MDETLKLRKSPSLIVTQITIWLLLLVSIVFLVFGIFDFRSDEQKKADERTELVSQATFQRGVTALKYLYNNQNSLVADEVTEVSSVSCLKGSMYVLVIYEDEFGYSQELTYDGKYRRGYRGRDLYSQTLSSLISRDLLLGTKKDSSSYVAKYEGENLKIMLEETGLVWR